MTVRSEDRTWRPRRARTSPSVSMKRPWPARTEPPITVSFMKLRRPRARRRAGTRRLGTGCSAAAATGKDGGAGHHDGQPRGAEGPSAQDVGDPVHARVDPGYADQGGQYRRACPHFRPPGGPPQPPGAQEGYDAERRVTGSIASMSSRRSSGLEAGTLSCSRPPNTGALVTDSWVSASSSVVPA